MNTWTQAGRAGVKTGALASVASAATLAAAAMIEGKRPVAPINAVSHWLWGRRAFRQDNVSAKFTLPGYLVHHLSAMFWATLYEKFRVRRREPVVVLRDAAIAAAIACAVDYKMTPERLKPGYERRLSRKSLFAVYAVFALGLAAGAAAGAARRERWAP